MVINLIRLKIQFPLKRKKTAKVLTATSFRFTTDLPSD